MKVQSAHTRMSWSSVTQWLKPPLASFKVR